MLFFQFAEVRHPCLAAPNLQAIIHADEDHVFANAGVLPQLARYQHTTGAIDLWIEVGQPDEKRLLKACGRSMQVVVYSYSSASHIWWSQIAGKVERAKNLRVLNLPVDASAALGKLVQRTMQLQCTIQDGLVWMSSGDQTVQLDLTVLKKTSSDS